ncbi:MAG: 50S ribosomal protein L3 [Candidatus Marsarchaeota archaeon]|nr:50S ribosomal protein L3 [Candidatus Marsarchaeota archaeon]MCL5094821.1 50S ribosomal protein L3 [Candidatus Marsarchaeota archaeon]
MTKGSLQYWPRKRARKRLPRIRSYNNHGSENCFSNIIGYKVGMRQLTLIDDSQSSSKGLEVNKACTFVEIPKLEVYGLRFYKKDNITNYSNTYQEIHNQAICQNNLNMKKIKINETKINEFKQKLNEFSDISALLVAYPGTISIGQHKVVKFEAKIVGKNIQQKFDFAANFFGKEIKASDIFKNGEFIDVTSISKGKGWQGAIKRHGVSRLNHKATQKTRHVGVLGSFGIGRVLYSVPHSGQLGFNYRTEYSKRILKIANDKIETNSGFLNYGNIKNEYIIIEGSIPGPVKRLVRIRKTMRNKNMREIKEPKINQLIMN